MKSFIIFLFAILYFHHSEAQLLPFQARHNYGARLEPANRVLTAAGQVQGTGAFPSYWQSVSAQSKPAVFMVYSSLNECGYQKWVADIKQELQPYKDTLVMLQVGLSMTQEAGNGSLPVPYTDAVANGSKDKEIDGFLTALEQLGLPVYIRIGYEFNGQSWNGYEATSYKNAFVYVANKIRDRKNLSAATVWCIVASGGTANFESFYPGDTYTDWWAIDLFSATDFTENLTNRFIDSAHAHQKPLMIGEATPRFVGVMGGASSWNTWFVPYFNFIHTHKGVKMSSYINWNWASYPQWASWGNAILSQNSLVESRFSAALDSALYLHAAPEPAFKKKFYAATDTIAAPPVINLTATASNKNITWTHSPDTAGRATYLIAKNGQPYDRTNQNQYVFTDLKAQTTFSVGVQNVDTAGNVSDPSNMVQISVPNHLDKAVNGNFEDSLSCNDWTLANLQGAASDYQRDNNQFVEGSHSIKVNITQQTGTAWHIQLFQEQRLYADRTYKLVFYAKANVASPLSFFIQKNKAPWTVYAQQSVNLSTNQFNKFTFDLPPNLNDTTRIAFLLGNNNYTTIWLDSIAFIESAMPLSLHKNAGSHEQFVRLFSSYAPHQVTVTAPQAIHNITCYNVSGQEVPLLFKPSGLHTYQAATSALKSGLYIVAIQYNNQLIYRRFVR